MMKGFILSIAIEALISGGSHASLACDCQLLCSSSACMEKCPPCDSSAHGRNLDQLLEPFPFPVDPIDTETPTDPMDPVDPVNPFAPVNPLTPADPLPPVDPEAPVDPTDPVDPLDPVNPIDPMVTMNTVEPIDLLDPATPVDPLAPADPIDPMNPVVDPFGGDEELALDADPISSESASGLLGETSSTIGDPDDPDLEPTDPGTQITDPTDAVTETTGPLDAPGSQITDTNEPVTGTIDPANQDVEAAGSSNPFDPVEPVAVPPTEPPSESAAGLFEPVAATPTEPPSEAAAGVVSAPTTSAPVEGVVPPPVPTLDSTLAPALGPVDTPAVGPVVETQAPVLPPWALATGAPVHGKPSLEEPLKPKKSGKSDNIGQGGGHAIGFSIVLMTAVVFGLVYFTFCRRPRRRDGMREMEMSTWVNGDDDNGIL